MRRLCRMSALALCGVGMVVPAAGASAADKQGFSLSGTSRFRYEAIDGQARVGFNKSDDLFDIRTTLLGQYVEGPVRIAAELWDSRVYGDRRGTPVTTGEVNALEFVQAFVEVKAHEPFGGSSSAAVQAGRFILNLGSRRLVAADDYRNTTSGYTGLRVDAGWRGGWRATAIYTLPQQRRPDDSEGLRDKRVVVDHEGWDQVLWGGVISHTLAPAAPMAELSFFHLGEHDTPGRPTRDRSLDTVSARLIRQPAPGHSDFEVEGIAQLGHVSASLAPTAPRQSVRAWFLHASVGRTLRATWSPRVSLEYDHASGDKPGGHYGRFDSLFGMRRADYAPAGLYNAVQRANLISPAIRLQLTPDKTTDGFILYRPMWLAAREDAFATTGVRDPSGRSGRFAGHQIDGRIRHDLTRFLRLELDGTLLAKGRFLRDAPNATPGGWTRYIAMNATVSF